MCVNVFDFGAKGDGVTDDTTAVQQALNYSRENNVLVEFGSNEFRLTNTITFLGNCCIKANDTKFICDFEGEGVVFTGGAYFNYVFGYLTVTRSENYRGSLTAPSTNPNSHGVVFRGNRVVADYIRSSYHKGNGFNFESVNNANKSSFNNLFASSNCSHGFHFQGTQDDSSVWDINFFAKGNYLSGFYFEGDYAGRNWYGSIYSEDNCIDTTYTEVNIGSLNSSILTIYAESSSNILDLLLGENTSNLSITSCRNSKDRDLGSNNVFLYGNSVYMRNWGNTANNLPSELFPYFKPKHDLSTKGNRYMDSVIQNSNTNFVKRTFGTDKQQRLIFDRTALQGTIETEERYSRRIQAYGDSPILKYNYRTSGTIDEPANISSGDVLTRELYGGTSGGGHRSGLLIETVVSGTNNAYIGVDYNIYTKTHRESVFDEQPTLKILNTGDIELGKISKGLILHSPNNTSWKLTVNDDGEIVVTQV